MILLKRLFFAFVLVAAAAAPAGAQTPAHDARLILTAADQTGAILPGATVTVTGTEEATKSSAPIVVHTADRGVVTIDKLAAGKYSVRVEMDGFTPTFMPELKLVKGDTKRTITMALKSMSDEVTVQVDKLSAATDRNLTFGSALTREQIEGLPDDPAELEKALKDMAGSDAVIRVDSFEGGKLPDKSQIKAIHISRDQFAAENHYAGGISIDIVTQAGSGPLRMNGSYNLRDSSMDGKNANIGARAPTRSQNTYFSGGGTLIPQKLSVSFSGGVRRSFSTPLFFYNQPDGTRVSAPADVKAPSNGVNLYTDLTYALTKDQTLRVYYSQSDYEDRYQGIGGYSQLERAYASKSRFYSVRGQEAGPLGRRFVTNTKFSLNVSKQDTTSASDALTIIVPDAFTIGGAQRRGGRQTKEFMLQSDLDYVRGMHTVRTGVLLQGGNYRSDDSSNYTGTYVFESLAAYNAGTPRSFTMRIGDPLIDYFNVQAGWYIQDDIRVRKNLSLSPGVRYEVQTHLRDFGGIGPRFGITYSPFKNGKTSLRASWGIFHDWYSSGTYEQSLRVDGFRQQEMTIANPVYPNAGSNGVVGPTTRYLVDPNLRMSRNMRLSAGIDETFTPRMRVSATYAYTQIEHAYRGENLNAPVNGVRPDPSFANVVRVLSDAAGRQHMVTVSTSWQFAAPSPQLQAARFNIRRGSLSLYYSLGSSRNNYDSAFSTPATGNIANEWGPANFDVRQRVNLSVNSSAIKNMNLGVNVSASTGSPYNITTGHDDNGDLILNDRPAGVGRNAGRGGGQWNVNANLSYNRTFGKTKSGGASGPPGIMISSMGGGPMTVTTVAAPPGRYRMSIFISAYNVTNHANQFGYSGVMTSPNFGKPTAIAGVRQVNIGINFGF